MREEDGREVQNPECRPRVLAAPRNMFVLLVPAATPIIYSPITILETGRRDLSITSARSAWPGPEKQACCAAVILIKLRSGDCPDAAFCLAFPRSQPVSSLVLTIWNLGEMASRGILAVLALLLVATYAQKTSQQDPAGGNTQPNMIFILTDDQDLHMDSVAYMPHLKKLIIEQGMTFEKHYCTVALCCPSRVSLWTGKAAHNTNVTDVNPPYGR